MNINIVLSHEYTIKEIEKIFNTNFGSRIKGITLRKWDDGTPYILLFSRKAGPYTDKIEGNIFYYDGEGKNRDQEFKGANKELANSNETGRVIYGFRQEVDGGKWKYLGILKVLDYSIIKKSGYKTIEFKLGIEGLDISEDFSPELEDIFNISNLKKPKLYDNEKEKISVIKRKRRDAVFSEKIKEYYENTCAICGKKRFTASHYPEVEAAHIYPKEKNGSDDLRNGIALCKLHHWAFDGGLFSINDDYSIIVKSDIKSDDNYEEIYKFEKLKINLPKNPRYNPHSLFLKEHRKIHSYE